MVIVFKFQEVAFAGCSCNQYRPAADCSRYMAAQNSTCRTAFLFLFSNSCLHSAPFLWRLSAWSTEKSVHGGDPTTRKGLCFCMYWMARSRSSVLSKSHPVNRSIDSPAINPISAAASAIRGGEKTSAKSLPVAIMPMILRFSSVLPFDNVFSNLLMSVIRFMYSGSCSSFGRSSLGILMLSSSLGSFSTSSFSESLNKSAISSSGLSTSGSLLSFSDSLESRSTPNLYTILATESLIP